MWWLAALGFVVAFSVGLVAGARVLALVLLGLAVAGCGVVTGKVDVLSLVGGQAAPVRTATLARHSLCGRPRTGAPDYGWPVKPFGVQHPVRGNFGDPRTISAGEFGIVSIRIPGAYSFHNGVDIAAVAGTPVYPVVSGVAHRRFNDEVIVAAGDRAFQYWHITPVVRDGQLVVARRTILGRVQYPANHVHLTEIDDGHVTNPGLHLRPYHDHTAPSIDAIELRDTAGRALHTDTVEGRISIIARAEDTPPLAVPGAWDGFPVGPAVVRWRLLGPNGESKPWRVAADFRRSQPPQADFWTVYAPGTYQNFPVFDRHFFWRQAGRFLFRLTKHPLDTRRLLNGTYTLEVTSQDICGNRGALTQQLVIDNEPA